VLDNYEFLTDNDTSPFARFVPYTQWQVDIQVTLPNNQIFREAQTQCLTDIPNSFNLTGPSEFTQSGIFFAFNPTAVDNSLLYSITTVPADCMRASNVPFTIPAFSFNRIVFTNCQVGATFTLTFFQRTGTFATPCPGTFVFTQGAGLNLIPGSQAPNVQANQVEVRNSITNGFTENSNQLTSFIVETATLLIQGPTTAVFNQLYAAANATLAVIFNTAANITGCNVINGQGCGIDGIFNDWAKTNEEFTRARDAAQSALSNATKKNEQLQQDNEALFNLIEFGNNLTQILTENNEDLQNKIQALSNEIQNFIKSSGGSGGIQTWVLVLLILIVLVLTGLAIYYFCFKKKDVGNPLPKVPGLPGGGGGALGGGLGGKAGAAVAAAGVASSLSGGGGNFGNSVDNLALFTPQGRALNIASSVLGTPSAGDIASKGKDLAGSGLNAVKSIFANRQGYGRVANEEDDDTNIEMAPVVFRS
jgi:hypothetical protein